VGRPGGRLQLLNASYDATRELYRTLNRLFSDHHAVEHGEPVRVRQSHGGSGSQARAVLDGLPADVVTLALPLDVLELVKAGVVDPGWESRFENGSLPYTSTIVFVVRRGNPHKVADWPDLVARPGLRLVAANPKTGGAAKLAFLAAWGWAKRATGSDAQAENYVRQFYKRVPLLEPSSRSATLTFARKAIGDVNLTWENEALLQVRELPGELEIVYPSVSIRAEPIVAVVDATARRNGTAALAEAYLRFLYNPPAQAAVAAGGFRPAKPPPGHPKPPGPAGLLEVTSLLPGGWAEAQDRFFAEGGLFDRVY
jgi:sulfate transport system substrate-binding protein